MHRWLIFISMLLWLASCSLKNQPETQSALQSGDGQTPQASQDNASQSQQTDGGGSTSSSGNYPYATLYPGYAGRSYYYDPYYYDDFCYGDPFFYDPYCYGGYYSYYYPYCYPYYYSYYYPYNYDDDDFIDYLEDLYDDDDLRDALEELVEARREFWEELFEEVGEWVEDRRDRRKQRRENVRDRVEDRIDRRRHRRQKLIDRVSDLFERFPDRAALIKRRSVREALSSLPERRRLPRMHSPPRLRPNRHRPAFRSFRGDHGVFGRPGPFRGGIRGRR